MFFMHQLILLLSFNWFLIFISSRNAQSTLSLSFIFASSWLLQVSQVPPTRPRLIIISRDKDSSLIRPQELAAKPTMMNESKECNAVEWRIIRVNIPICYSPQSPPEWGRPRVILRNIKTQLIEHTTSLKPAVNQQITVQSKSHNCLSTWQKTDFDHCFQ